MLLLSSVQYNQTFSTTPAGNSRQFYPRPRYSREHCTRSRIYRGFHIFFNPVPAGNPQISVGLAPCSCPCKTVVYMHVYCSVIYEVGNCNLGPSAVISWENDGEYDCVLESGHAVRSTSH